MILFKDLANSILVAGCRRALPVFFTDADIVNYI